LLPVEFRVWGKDIGQILDVTSEITFSLLSVGVFEQNPQFVHATETFTFMKEVALGPNAFVLGRFLKS